MPTARHSDLYTQCEQYRGRIKDTIAYNNELAASSMDLMRETWALLSQLDDHQQPELGATKPILTRCALANGKSKSTH